jgi:hypothetical protein
MVGQRGLQECWGSAECWYIETDTVSEVLKMNAHHVPIRKSSEDE